jgi:hypothetical protein
MRYVFAAGAVQRMTLFSPEAPGWTITFPAGV